MNRRGFLSGLIALPAVSYFLPPVNGWPTGRILKGDMSRYLTSNVAWFIKTEHADGVALFSRAHPPLGTVMGAVLRPGLEKFWGEEDDKHSEDGAALYGDSLDPNSIKEIEIEYKRSADALGRTSPLLQTQRVAIADASAGRSYQSEREGGILVPRLPRFRKEDT